MCQVAWAHCLHEPTVHLVSLAYGGIIKVQRSLLLDLQRRESYLTFTGSMVKVLDISVHILSVKTANSGQIKTNSNSF